MRRRHLPHDIHPRRDTGQYNARLGLWLTLASLVMFLAALYSAYAMLRYNTDNWTAFRVTLSPGWGLVGLVFQCAIAMLMPWGWRQACDGRFWMAWSGLGICLLLGLLALGNFSRQMYGLAQDGLAPARHNFYALFHLFTGVQMLFIGIGMFFCVVYLLSPGNKQYRLRNRMECLGIYLHFVAAAGGLHFTLFYVL